MEAHSPLPRRRFVFGKLVQVLLGLLVGLGAADVLAGKFDTERDLRHTGALDLDDQLAWVNRPNFVFANGKTHINSLGLRGAEIPDDASPTELRVLGVGASRTFGDGTDEDHLVWSHVLERLLEREAVDARVLNGGVNGYSALQSARRAMRLSATLEPDLILLIIAPSAQVLLDGSSAGQWVRVGGEVVPRDIVDRVPGPLRPLAASLHKTLLRSNLYTRYRAQVGEEQNRPADLARFILTERPAPAAAKPLLDATWLELGTLAEHCRTTGIELRVVVIPQGNQASGPAWREWLLASVRKGGPPLDTSREEPTAALLAKLTELGIATWDFSDEAEFIGRDVDKFTLDGNHWTAPGHRVIATGVLKRLLGEPALLAELTARRRRHPRG